MRIGINEHQPISGSCCCAPISRAADLVDWLEHDLGASGLRDLRCPIGRVVVADDEFGFPTAIVKCFRRSIHGAERSWQQLLFVKRWNDDGNFHRTNIKVGACCPQRAFGSLREVAARSRQCALPNLCAFVFIQSMSRLQNNLSSKRSLLSNRALFLHAMRLRRLRERKHPIDARA